jgi:hypothetical protein
MHYEIWKWLETGDVEFHLRAVSKPAERGPFLLRTGPARPAERTDAQEARLSPLRRRANGTDSL